jgi:hypothetical protein
MRSYTRIGLVAVAMMGLVLLFSCSKKEKKEAGGAPADSTKKDTTLSYVSQEVGFGVFFDEQGTKRTVKLGARDKQVMIHIVVNFPETMQVSAVEYRLVLPTGVTIENDKFYPERVALLGTFEGGISETFPCVPGPKILLHSLTLNVPPGLKDAEIALMPHAESKFIGIAMCDEEHTMVAGTSYKAVINPTE